MYHTAITPGGSSCQAQASEFVSMEVRPVKSKRVSMLTRRCVLLTRPLKTVTELKFKLDWKGSEATLRITKQNELSLFLSEPTDEGFHSECHTYTWDHRGLHLTINTSSRDCDGPHHTHLALLADRLHEGWPVWEKVRSSQRDVYAERMGY